MAIKPSNTLHGFTWVGWEKAEKKWFPKWVLWRMHLQLPWNQTNSEFGVVILVVPSFGNSKMVKIKRAWAIPFQRRFYPWLYSENMEPTVISQHTTFDCQRVDPLYYHHYSMILIKSNIHVLEYSIVITLFHLLFHCINIPFGHLT